MISRWFIHPGLCAVLAVLSWSATRADTLTVVPGIGVVGWPAVADRPTLAWAIKRHGPGYRIERNADWHTGTLWYDSLGIGFRFEAYDRRRLILSFTLRAPCNARVVQRQTQHGGAVLGVTTVRELPRLFRLDRDWRRLRDRADTGGATMMITGRHITVSGERNQRITEIVVRPDEHMTWSEMSWVFVDTTVQDCVARNVADAATSPKFTGRELCRRINAACITGDSLIGLPPRSAPAINAGQLSFDTVEIGDGLNRIPVVFGIGNMQYTAQTLVVGDTVVAIAIRKYQSGWEGGDALIRTIVANPAVLARLIQQHERAYGIQVDLNGCEYSPFTGCLPVISNEEQGNTMTAEMSRHITQRDTTALTRLLYSMNPYTALHGAVGLLILQRRGLPIGATQQRRIAELRSRTRPLPWRDASSWKATTLSIAPLLDSAQATGNVTLVRGHGIR